MMTGSVREDGFASSGSTDMSPEQRVPEWGGDHLADPTGAELDGDTLDGDTLGVDPTELTDEDLIREMHSLHRTRLDTLRHAADSALANHLRRTAELETEYLARHPGREVDPGRLRDA
ncbi:hypothetical protein F8271_16225 [Micromonospora sp. ALFpr18c]|uniref:DUF6158 family protein n=1 Tax=unclassified Micromonospora TaxID=2617518 RepID=UPI00124B7046|nr:MULTISPECIES: DUF6158 family protein [unclassified Micromonospora]KAB1940410.1 hypothetical protein F8271_16225 [Micromonospora sp. ALFpr18c]MDG4756362.1 DUF6158 family protein [Micromonospora sp. WMMD710]